MSSSLQAFKPKIDPARAVSPKWRPKAAKRPLGWKIRIQLVLAIVITSRGDPHKAPESEVSILGLLGRHGLQINSFDLIHQIPGHCKQYLVVD
ncbi:MAG: hypothetical protein CBC48_19350 [bacterium TMED88]|nr:hypothetical protein [Deltaproteobacteria bacterium]OUV22801.1 MAG: hypothetical protein CBC48_19350 [bacterium TMED88]